MTTQRTQLEGEHQSALSEAKRQIDELAAQVQTLQETHEADARTAAQQADTIASLQSSAAPLADDSADIHNHYSTILQARDAQIAALLAEADSASLTARIAQLETYITEMRTHYEGILHEKDAALVALSNTPGDPTGGAAQEDVIAQLREHYEGLLRERDVPGKTDEERAALASRVEQLEAYIEQLRAHYESVVAKQQEDINSTTILYEENLALKEKELELSTQEAALLVEEKTARTTQLQQECTSGEALQAENHRLALKLQSLETQGDTTPAQEALLLRQKGREWELEKERMLLFQQRLQEEASTQRDRIADLLEEVAEAKAAAATVAPTAQPDVPHYVEITSATDPVTGVRMNTEVKRPVPITIPVDSPTAGLGSSTTGASPQLLAGSVGSAPGGSPLAKGRAKSIPLSVMLFEAIFSLGGFLPSTQHALPKASQV